MGEGFKERRVLNNLFFFAICPFETEQGISLSFSGDLADGLQIWFFAQGA